MEKTNQFTAVFSPWLSYKSVVYQVLNGLVAKTQGGSEEVCILILAVPQALCESMGK